MIKVLVADDDLDAHELVHDILEINFKNVTIDRALSYEKFHTKIDEADPQYDLILFNLRLEEEWGKEVLASIRKNNPELANRIVLITDSPAYPVEDPLLKSLPSIPKPFSLDHFGEIVKKTCSC
jgi:DNA-binding NtrC family response regulator